MHKYKKEDLISREENIRIEKKTATTIAQRNEEEHTHEFVEIVYVKSGSATQYVGDSSFDVSRGDLFFIDYNQTHAFKAKENDYSYIDILIDPVIVSKELSDKMSISEIFAISIFNEINFNKQISVQHMHFGGEERTGIENLLYNMLLEFEKKQLGYVSVMSQYTKVLFSLICRNLGKETTSEVYIKDSVLDVIEYVNAHCCEKISLEKLAQKCFYNPTYLSHVFKKYCGKTLSTYVKERRISYAVELLETTNYTVAKISEMVGYNDKASFYKMFKAVTGKLPMEYREN